MFRLADINILGVTIDTQLTATQMLESDTKFINIEILSIYYGLPTGWMPQIALVFN